MKKYKQFEDKKINKLFTVQRIAHLLAFLKITKNRPIKNKHNFVYNM